MAAVGADADVFGVEGSRGGGPVVGGDDVALIVVVEDEGAPLGMSGLIEVDLAGESDVAKRSFRPAPAVNLEDAAGRDGAESGEGPRTIGVEVLRAVHAAHHVREAEVAEQALADAILFERSEDRIFGFRLAAVGEFKAADAQAVVSAFEAHKTLFEKDEAGIAGAVVGCEVAAAETELTLRGGTHGAIGDAEQ